MGRPINTNIRLVGNYWRAKFVHPTRGNIDEAIAPATEERVAKTEIKPWLDHLRSERPKSRPPGCPDIAWRVWAGPLSNAQEAAARAGKARLLYSSERRLKDLEQQDELTSAVVRERIRRLEATNAEMRRQISDMEGLVKIRADKARTGSLAEEAEKWTADYARRPVSPRRKIDVATVINKFVAAMGPRKSPHHVTEADVAAYLHRLQVQNIAPYRGYICGFMEAATRGVFAPSEVRREFGPTRRRKRGRKIDWLTKEQLADVLACLHGTWRDICALQAYMGWRPTELAILKKSNIVDGVITLEMVPWPQQDRLLGKTGARSLKIPENAAKAVANLSAAGDGEALVPWIGRSRKPRIDPPVRGGWNPDTFSDRLCDTVKQACHEAKVGVPGAAYLLRRTFGSNLLRATRRVSDVATALGTTSEAIIREHYARILAEELDIEY